MDSWRGGRKGRTEKRKEGRGVAVLKGKTGKHQSPIGVSKKKWEDDDVRSEDLSDVESFGRGPGEKLGENLHPPQDINALL